jgi:Rieske Fe-S protein
MGDDTLHLSLQTRRQFCARAFGSIAALGAGVPLCSGCSSPTSPSAAASNLPAVNATQSGPTYLVTIDASSPLAAVGSLAYVQGPAGVILAAHPAENTFNAFSASCTHQACTITNYSGQAFVCPCHGSKFDTNGNVVLGPASRSLTRFPTTFLNNVLAITI